MMMVLEGCTEIGDPLREEDIQTKVKDPLTKEDTLIEDPLVMKDPQEEDILIVMGDPLEEEDTLVEDPLIEMEDPLMVEEYEYGIDHTEEVVIGSEQGTTFPTKIGTTVCNALINTDATRCCINEEYYRKLQLTKIHLLQNVM